jgi:hypothetical protein
MPGTLVLRRCRQEDQFKVTFKYTAKVKTNQGYMKLSQRDRERELKFEAIFDITESLQILPFPHVQNKNKNKIIHPQDH